MAGSQAQRAAGGAAAVRNILNQQIGDALDALRGPGKVSDAAIHAARKDLKRARAGLRLLRIAAGAQACRRENAALRDAARPLSLVRDAKVLLDATTKMLEHEKKPAARAALERLRRVLRSEQRRARAELSRGAGGFKQIVHALEAARSSAAQLPVKNERPSALRAGMERIYRKGRNAMREADAVRSDEKLHEARKQVKYLGAAMKYFDEIGAADLGKLTARAGSLADDLGDDHDLAVLQAKIATLTDGSGYIDAALALHIRRRRTQLQTKALKQARLLYHRKPAAFIASL